jgi:hypothetical protein
VIGAEDTELKLKEVLMNRRIRPVTFVFAVGCSSLALVAACSSSGGGGEDVGVASAAISQVPAQVGCIEIDVTGARSVTERFDVTAGQSPVLSITGLPLGLDTFVGLAYPGACAAVTNANQATWISDATQASLVAQQVASVALSLHPNGESSIAVSFDGDDGGVDAGSTTAACTAGQALCGATCTNLLSDITNCGTCGLVCAPGPNAAGTTCSNGLCQVAICAAGWADCDSNSTDGCEINVASSISNCGACGNVCNTGNGAPACTNGVCRIAVCPAGFSDCDGIASNGCETNTNSSATNCGTCGHACTATPSICANGKCQ